MPTRLLQSRIVTFIVGPEKKSLKIHEDVLCAISKPFNTMLKGSMKEAIEGVVLLEDVESENFLDLVNYAYTRSLPKVRINVEQPHATQSPLTLYDIAYGNYLPEKTAAAVMTRAFTETVSDMFSRYQFEDMDEDRGSYTSHGEELIRRIRLYILADRFLIHELRAYCLFGMAKTLEALKTTELAQSLADGIRLVWQETVEKDEARRLLVRAVTASFPVLIRVSEDTMKALMREFPGLAVEVMLGLPDGVWEMEAGQWLNVSF